MKHLLAAAAAATVLLSGGSALAQSISATTTEASPSGTFGRFRNVLPNCQIDDIGSRFYELRTLTVGTTGNYTFTDESSLDAILGIYDGGFNPADSTENCVIGLDDGSNGQDGSAVTLNAGTYTVMFSSFDQNETGVATYDYTGPGVLTVGPLASPETVPTLSEWGMILMGMLLAGGAAAILQRRRLAA